MTDLVKRLRDISRNGPVCRKAQYEAHEAADRIEALEAEVARLRLTLTRIDRLTEEAPFDFGLIRLIARQAPGATEDLNRIRAGAMREAADLIMRTPVEAKLAEGVISANATILARADAVEGEA